MARTEKRARSAITHETWHFLAFCGCLNTYDIYPNSKQRHPPPRICVYKKKDIISAFLVPILTLTVTSLLGTSTFRIRDTVL
jgi:hypothetical protein